MQTSKLLRTWHPVRVVTLFFVVLSSLVVAAPHGAKAQEVVLPTPLNPQDLSWRLHTVQSDIATLQSKRPGIAGPIVVLALGAGLALAPIQVLPYTYDSPHQGAEARRGRRLLGGVSIAGCAITVGGIAWLVRRARKRAFYGYFIKGLKQERKVLIRALRELDYDASAGVDGLHFLARGRF